MSKDWQKGSGYVAEPKVTRDPGVSKDGYSLGGKLLKQLTQQNHKQLL